MKLRLLNASHQGMCYFGHLADDTYAHEAAQDPRRRSPTLKLGGVSAQGRPRISDPYGALGGGRFTLKILQRGEGMSGASYHALPCGE